MTSHNHQKKIAVIMIFLGLDAAQLQCPCHYFNVKGTVLPIANIYFF